MVTKAADGLYHVTAKLMHIEEVDRFCFSSVTSFSSSISDTAYRVVPSTTQACGYIVSSE